MADYIPPTLDWVREQVELYEGSNGTEVKRTIDVVQPKEYELDWYFWTPPIIF